MLLELDDGWKHGCEGAVYVCVCAAGDGECVAQSGGSDARILFVLCPSETVRTADGRELEVTGFAGGT